MGVAVLVGTQKGALVLRSDGRAWARSSLLMKGWLVTAFARDSTGRAYAGVTHDVWGPVVMGSDDLEHRSGSYTQRRTFCTPESPRQGSFAVGIVARRGRLRRG